jgi:hypothetical protein
MVACYSFDSIKQKGNECAPITPYAWRDVSNRMVHRTSHPRNNDKGRSSSYGGEGEIVEIDENFIGKKEDEPIRRGYVHKHAVMTLVQRGGSARPIIKANVHPGTRVMTDEAGQYAHLEKYFTEHTSATVPAHIAATISIQTRLKASTRSSNAA